MKTNFFKGFNKNEMLQDLFAFSILFNVCILGGQLSADEQCILNCSLAVSMCCQLADGLLEHIYVSHYNVHSSYALGGWGWLD